MPTGHKNSVTSSLESNPFATNPGFRWLGNLDFTIVLVVLMMSLPWLPLYWLTGVYSDARFNVGLLSLVFVALFAVSLGSWINRLRGAQSDLQNLLTLTGEEQDELLSIRLYGSSQSNLRLTAAGVLVGIGLNLTGSIFAPNQQANTLSAIAEEYFFFNAPASLIAWDYISLAQFWFIGIFLVHGLACQWRQNREFQMLTCKIHVDLLNTAGLKVVGNPMIRGLVAPIVVLAAAGPLLFVNDGNVANGFYLLAVPLACLLLLFAVSAGQPVWVVRKMIIARKREEMDKIERFLNGDAGAMATSRIAVLQPNLTAIEVLAWREHVQSIWNWPLHDHLPRILFYLTIPPLAWAAAAFVERVVDASLG